MKHAITLFAAFSIGLLMQRLIFGYDLAYQMAYGAISAMAVLISATFFWLWWQRATPLALGMGFSWAGAGMVMGYWWVHNLLDRPDWMDENPILFVFLAAYIVGAILHFRVIAQTVPQPFLAFWTPLLMLVSVALGTVLLV